MYLLFKEMSEEEKTHAIQSLMEESTPKPSFFFLVRMSAIMATLGLLMNNVSVIIGSMLIAPLLSPILALALGMEMRERLLIYRSLRTLVRAFFSSLFVSLITALLLSRFAESSGVFSESFNAEILARTEIGILFFLVALVAGMTTAFARMKEELNDTLPGTAIAIALVPPIANIGIGIATLNGFIASRSFLLFLLNAVGIIIGALFIFSLMGIRRKKRIAKKAAIRADRKLEKMKEEHAEEQAEEKIESLKESLGIEKIENRNEEKKRG